MWIVILEARINNISGWDFWPQNKKQQPQKTPPPTITANINRKESNII